MAPPRIAAGFEDDIGSCLTADVRIRSVCYSAKSQAITNLCNAACASQNLSRTFGPPFAGASLLISITEHPSSPATVALILNQPCITHCTFWASLSPQLRPSIIWAQLSRYLKCTFLDRWPRFFHIILHGYLGHDCDLLRRRNTVFRDI